MICVSIEEIKDNLSAYLHRVEAGETLIIMRADKAVAELRPLSQASASSRPFGLCAGEFTVPDDFNEPLEVTAQAWN
jgi:antitoxin (DNA-binding transcriptional repressor) of toxin-antitoxin stability system